MFGKRISLSTKLPRSFLFVFLCRQFRDLYLTFSKIKCAFFMKEMKKDSLTSWAHKYFFIFFWKSLIDWKKGQEGEYQFLGNEKNKTKITEEVFWHFSFNIFLTDWFLLHDVASFYTNRHIFSESNHKTILWSLQCDYFAAFASHSAILAPKGISMS